MLAAALPTALLLAAAPAAPPDDAIPAGGLGEAIRLGKALFSGTATHPLTKEYVRNGLSCASCHPGSGAANDGPTLVGAATAYPAWSPRERAVITLEDRVLNCFMRSLGGIRPPNGSRPSVAITAYLTWLSTGMPIAMNPRAPVGPHAFEKLPVDRARVDLARGRGTYAARCAECHGAGGSGEPPLPAVWGPRSFTAGAGLAEVPKLAGWLRVAMPPGGPALSAAEAVNVAAFVAAQPRPDFVLKDHLPRGATYNANVRDEVVRAPTWPPPR